MNSTAEMGLSTKEAELNGLVKAHPSPAALAHVVLRTTAENYRAMLNFYLDVLQARIAFEAPTFAMLRYDFEHHRIAIIQVPGTTTKPVSILNPGIEHTAFTYATLTELAQTYCSLKSMKNPVTPFWAVNHGMTTSLYYKDPDGNKVELQVDNFDTTEEADVFMKDPLFEQNPIGTDFDPDAWARKILSKQTKTGEEGLSATEVKGIKTRTEIGSRDTFPPDLFDKVALAAST